MSKIVNLQQLGKELGQKMNEAEKNGFFYKVMRYLQLDNRANLNQLIIKRAQKYKLVEKFDTVNMQKEFSAWDYDELSKKIILFLMEVMQSNEKSKKEVEA